MKTGVETDYTPEVVHDDRELEGSRVQILYACS
jgi:hypothetical protein